MEASEVLEALLDLDTLAELRISQCSFTAEFLQDVGHTLKETRRTSPIRRLYAQVPSSDCLNELLDCSESLPELNIVSGNDEVSALIARIDRIGPGLKVLGLHASHEDPNDDILVEDDWDRMDSLFEACSNLEQLGYPLLEVDVKFDWWKRQDEFIERWGKCLSHTSILKQANRSVAQYQTPEKSAHVALSITRLHKSYE